MARYELQEGTSSKFWEITLSGRSFTTHWGRIGGTPTNQTKSWPDDATARKEHDKLVHEKTHKGYVLVGAKVPKAAKVAGKKSGKVSPKADPPDDASWQVHADELQAKGDPRGNVLAIQEALRKKPDDAALRKAECESLAPLLTGKLKDYLVRFEKMAETLRKDSSKLFTGYFALPPAPEREIAEVERSLGYPLHDSIKTFYRQANGLQLFVIDRDAENFDATRFKPMKKPFGKNDYKVTESPGPTHSVHILPIREAFLTDYEGRLYFDFMKDTEKTRFGKKSYPQLSFAKSLRPFDQMTDYYMMGFALIEKTGNPPVAFANDYGASWGDSTITDFESYMEFVLECRGRVEERDRHYNR